MLVPLQIYADDECAKFYLYPKITRTFDLGIAVEVAERIANRRENFCCSICEMIFFMIGIMGGLFYGYIRIIVMIGAFLLSAKILTRNIEKLYNFFSPAVL